MTVTSAPAGGRPIGRRSGAGLIADPVGRARRLRDDLEAAITSLVHPHATSPPAPAPTDREPVGQRPADEAPADRAPTEGAGAGRDGRDVTAPRPLVTDVYVGWFAALEARSCPARFRAGGEDGWGFPGWTPTTAAAAVGRAALARHLDAERRFGQPQALPDPLGLVRGWMRSTRASAEGGVTRWVSERMEEHDAAAMAATAAGAVRWLTGFVRVLGWPLPDGLAMLGVPGRTLHPWRGGNPTPTPTPDPGPGNPPTPTAGSPGTAGSHGTPVSRVGDPAATGATGSPQDDVPVSGTDSPQDDVPGTGATDSGQDDMPGTGPGVARPRRRAPVSVAPGADARWGRPRGSGDFAMVVHRPTSGDDGQVRDRAGFEAVAASLAIGIVPARVVVLGGDTGETAQLDVDEESLRLGSDLVIEVVRQRVRATTVGFVTDDARPSAACRYCPRSADCVPGRDWLEGPGRWGGGLPVH